jgi:hypothetical protein
MTKPMALLRNHAYTVTIKHVNTYGWPTEAEAIKDPYPENRMMVDVKDDELWIRGTHTTPLGITSRPVILESSESGASVRLHYLRNDGPDIMIFKVS